MKRYIVLIFLTYNTSSYSQKLDSLFTVKNSLIRKIKLLNDSLIKTEKEINKLETKEELSTIQKSNIKIYTLGTTYLREKPSFSSRKIKTIPHNSEITLLDYEVDSNYFKISFDSLSGFISELSIHKNRNTRNYIQSFKLKRIKANRIKKEENARVKQIELDKKYIAEYGRKTYDKLKKGYFWIGMSKEMAILSLGEPNKKNKSVNSWETREQWVYPNSGLYLYFKNGKLSSYQN
ncbi:conserved hypothetical protein [Tenacibaculum litopenaei]|uniref:SH3 domain-containing protein n=1 Tax=Tenacibaculum litopenaei TaxID=396016 RepID=UPI00389400E2